MSIRRLTLSVLLCSLILILSGMPPKSASSGLTPAALEALVVGRNVNMVAGTTLPNGDPYLQRQNEPSGAASTRNPLHLLFGSNDYRMVDMPASEGPLPGVPEGAAAGDAWLGIFKSFNGGESWVSALLPGHLKDLTAVGRSSPIYGLGAASDATVRAGANGLFYYSGIAFDRGLHGRSVIFVARFIDNNVTRLGDADPIKYIDTKIIDEGTSGQFADKPWIAVDAPRGGLGTVPILAPDTPVQNVARHSIYMAYSVFMGSLAGGDQSKIMFARSTDCGASWERPVKISESNLLNQGTTIAVSPNDGTIYIAWRRFGSSSEPSSIMVSRSNDFGATFTKAVAVAGVNAFDQFSAENRFRTYAFPTMAIDRDGIVYLAWAERMGPGGDARIVVATSADGNNWSFPVPVDNHEGRGHQFQPSLAYAAGRLTITWYDTRNSEGGYGIDISDPGPSGKRHTMDVRVAQALPSLSPTFTDFKQVSKYLYWVATDENGKVPDHPTIIRKENNYPNFALFGGGHNPFVGDYIDIAPAPRFLFDVDLGSPQTAGFWRFNALDSDPATTFISWTDNRDVRPPADGDWTRYNPPTVASSPTPCTDATRTGMRNQNIYNSHITQGLIIGAPVNTKPLIFPEAAASQKRTFLVFAKNVTEYPKRIRLTIEAPPGMQASFWDTWPVDDQEWVCQFLSCDDREITAEVAPYSSLTLTVFVQPYEANPYATLKVKVEEVDGQGSFLDHIVLNPDPVNTRTVPVAEEYHTPTVMLESPANVSVTDPTVLSQAIVYLPNLGDILNDVNPDVVTPAYRSPAYRSGNIVNPAYRSADVGDWPDGTVTDLQWRFTNNNDATSAYSFVPIGEPPSLPEGGTYQLLIYRISTTPSSGALLNDCSLLQDEHHDLLLKVDSPAFRSPAYRSPAYRSPAYRSPAYRSNTFSLAPGETAVCTLRIITASSSSGGGSSAQASTGLKAAPPLGGFDVGDYAKTIAGAAVPQAPEPDGWIGFSSSLYIIEQTLPPASVNEPYAGQLWAVGGTPVSVDNGGTPDDPRDDTWLYDGRWTVQPLSYVAGRPSGLSLNADGTISGTPVYYPDLTYPQALSFVAELTDAGSPAQVARREFWLTVGCVLHTITPVAGVGGGIIPPGPVQVPHGYDATFEIRADSCHHIADVIVDRYGPAPIDLGPAPAYTFTNVRADHTIEAIFALNTYTVTTTADPLQGGTINPPGPVTVACGAEQKFVITPADGYVLKDVLIDNASLGPVAEYTFIGAGAIPMHSIVAKFQPLESWVRRYNNSAMNGDDEAKALAVHKPTGQVYVTGYSTGPTTGPDYFTIRYGGDGAQGWSARYDGPAHLGDYATAAAVDAAGGVFVAGYGYRGMQVKHSDYATLRYDASGRLLWNSQYDDRRNGNDEIKGLAVDTGFVYITGRSEDSLSKNDPKHYDYFTIKYNPSTGAQVWAARYDGGVVLNGADEAVAIAVDAAGNVYVTGRSQGGPTGFDYATVKYDANGIQKWVRRYDNAGGIDEAAAIAVDAAGNVYVTGRSQGAGTGFDVATVKYDTDGNPVWLQRYNNAAANGADEAAALAVDTAGNVYVTGRSQGNGTDFDYVTIKYDTGGRSSWVSRYDYVALADEAAGIAVDAAGGVYVTGRSRGGATGFDYLTMKYDSAGKLVWRVRYNNSGVNGDDEAVAIALDAAGNALVTGRSRGGATGLDFATIKYKQ